MAGTLPAVSKSGMSPGRRGSFTGGATALEPPMPDARAATLPEPLARPRFDPSTPPRGGTLPLELRARGTPPVGVQVTPPRASSPRYGTVSPSPSSGGGSFRTLTIRLSDVRVIKRLGAGGFGEVWHVRHEGSKRDMALKRLHDGILQDGPSRESFLQEIRILSSVRHTNVVKVYGACDSPTKGLHLFTELCTGSWRGVLDRETPALPTVLNVLWCVANGMAFLHERNLVHRDLNSDNVLLRARDPLDGDYAVVADLGLARYVPDDVRMTVRGTTWIMAPEMLRGERFDATADVFSFGVLAIESLTRAAAEDVPRLNNFGVDFDAVAALLPARDARTDTELQAKLLDLARACCAVKPGARPHFGADKAAIVPRLMALLEHDAGEAADALSARALGMVSRVRQPSARVVDDPPDGAGAAKAAVPRPPAAAAAASAQQAVDPRGAVDRIVEAVLGRLFGSASAS